MDVCFPGIEKREVAIETEGNPSRNCLVSDLVPQGLCPVAYNHLVPYIQTLLEDGWFSWVTITEDTSYRRGIHAGDFTKKSVNRLYPNEVLVQCPSNDARILFGVGIRTEGNSRTITLRVMDSKGECPRNHKIGEVIEVQENGFPFPPTDFSSMFPYLLSSETEKTPFSVQTSSDKRVKEQESRGKEETPDRVCLCERGSPSGNISVESITFPCRYHQKPDTFTESDFTVDELCPNALYAAYPEALALLYLKSESSRTVRCPDETGNVVFKIESRPRLPRLLSTTISLVNRFMNLLSHPLDILEKDISITVVGTGGSCPNNHKAGDTFSLNLENKRKLCPASFYSLFPFYFAQAKKGESDFSLPCPDCVGTTYKVNNHKGHQGKPHEERKEEN